MGIDVWWRKASRRSENCRLYEIRNKLWEIWKFQTLALCAAWMERVAKSCHLQTSDNDPVRSDWGLRVQVPGEGRESLRCQWPKYWVWSCVYSWSQTRV